ncbi:MAG: YdcF family protein, partial [Pasteurella oralis]|uniref:YdcF family protein n=1 Tax=Pasteurella oralis TaxID=1071947 RepID=UPI00271165D7|nr:YdcF family protein [Pasteurella oralis]
MFELTKIITAAILPPFNVLILWLFALLFFVLNWRKLAYCSALLGIAILYIFSIPYTSERLHNSLVTEDNLTLDDYRQAQAIVLLGGGLRDSKELYAKLAINQVALERLRYAAYLQQETQLPLLITGSSPNGTSEAKVMAQELAQFFHIPTKWLEQNAKTTKENARFSREMLEKEGVRKIVLVTNQWHMQRAKHLFEQQGFDVLPASVGGGITPANYSWNLMYFVPQSGALHSNMHALKEWIGYW